MSTARLSPAEAGLIVLCSLQIGSEAAAAELVSLDQLVPIFQARVREVVIADLSLPSGKFLQERVSFADTDWVYRLPVLSAEVDEVLVGGTDYLGPADLILYPAIGDCVASRRGSVVKDLVSSHCTSANPYNRPGHPGRFLVMTSRRFEPSGARLVEFVFPISGRVGSQIVDLRTVGGPPTSLENLLDRISSKNRSQK